MRIRAVRPEFWQDEEVASWPEGQRLFYIGLWAICDDAGYFDLVPSRIAALLYPYEARHHRERRVEGWLEALTVAGKVTRCEGCGHAIVPTLSSYQRAGGTPSYTVKKEHDGEIRPTTDFPFSKVKVSKDKGGAGGGAVSPTEGSAAGFGGKLPPFDQIVGKPA